MLGRGGSSTVYRAQAPRLGVRVALKILNAHAAQDESFRERFVRESTLAAAINHPNVITIYDAGAWGDDLFIALRYVAGGDLNVPLKEGPLELNRALAILAQVASGLDAAHGRGLIHRDVKPANVMLDSGPGEGAPEVAYVTDFGLIKHVQSGGRATPTGDLLGTIDYVAPEQIEGRPVDGRADVYSLGCVAFECLTGRVPFARENDAAVLWAHMKDDRHLPRTFDRSSGARRTSPSRAPWRRIRRSASTLASSSSTPFAVRSIRRHTAARLLPYRRSGGPGCGPGDGRWSRRLERRVSRSGRSER